MHRSRIRLLAALVFGAGVTLATGARADGPKGGADNHAAGAAHGKPDGAGDKGAAHADKGADNASAKAANASDKGAEHADKGADNANAKADKGDDDKDKKDGGDAPGASEKATKHAAERKARKEHASKDREELRKQVTAALEGQPMSLAMREELKRHARRLARLERAKEVADEADDNDSVARADKLIAKENARHDKWMQNYDAKATPAAGGGK